MAPSLWARLSPARAAAQKNSDCTDATLDASEPNLSTAPTHAGPQRPEASTPFYRVTQAVAVQFRIAADESWSRRWAIAPVLWSTRAAHSPAGPSALDTSPSCFPSWGLRARCAPARSRSFPRTAAGTLSAGDAPRQARAPRQKSGGFPERRGQRGRRARGDGLSREPEVGEDLVDHGWLLDGGEHAQAAATAEAREHVELEDALEQRRPGARRSCRPTGRQPARSLSGGDAHACDDESAERLWAISEKLPPAREKSGEDSCGSQADARRGRCRSSASSRSRLAWAGRCTRQALDRDDVTIWSWFRALGRFGDDPDLGLAGTAHAALLVALHGDRVVDD
jgi:hypothetical protein